MQVLSGPPRQRRERPALAITPAFCFARGRARGDKKKVCPGEQKTLAIHAPVCYDNRALKSTYPGVAQMVARLNGVQEAAGSNPVTRTKKRQTLLRLSFFALGTCSLNQRPLGAAGASNPPLRTADARVGCPLV